MPEKSVRFKRLLAAAIDWNLFGLPAVIFACLFRDHLENPLTLIVLLPLMIAFPVGFVLRDLLFRGRSIGKRILGLTILNRRTLEPLTGSYLATRNLFFPLFLLDVIVLLASGSSLGDHSVGAIVVPCDQIPEIPVAEVRQADGKKTVLSIVTAVVVFIALLYGITFLALENVKEEAHYQLAYSYLISSEAFAGMEADPSDVKLTGFHSNTSIVNGEKDARVTFTFQIHGRAIPVICHENAEGWYVCTDCTQFQ